MSRLAILYLGVESGTCLDRANALRRLGHDVTAVHVRAMLPTSPWVDRIVWRFGAAAFMPWIRHALAERLRGLTFDLAYVDNGDCLDASALAVLRRHAGALVSYTIDDPFGQRDGRRFAAFRSAVPHYDLVVVVREPNVAEAHALGARRVLRVQMTADEIQHAPRSMGAADLRTWGSQVLFLGTWMPERGPFLARLLRLGVPLAIRGARWQRAPEWPELMPACLGGPVYGDDYARAIQGARVNLGLLSKGNRDEHTTRSLEIPALGALLCAERTAEHRAMYREGEEAVFWSDADECAAVCMAMLADEPRRRAIAAAGQRRVQADRHFNEPMLQSALDALALSTTSSVAA